MNNFVNDYAVQDSALALLAGGWKAEDREQMMQEYGLTEDEADAICSFMEANEEKLGNDYNSKN